jgi:hypothetical protein
LFFAPDEPHEVVTHAVHPVWGRDLLPVVVPAAQLLSLVTHEHAGGDGRDAQEQMPSPVHAGTVPHAGAHGVPPGL